MLNITFYRQPTLGTILSNTIVQGISDCQILIFRLSYLQSLSRFLHSAKSVRIAVIVTCDFVIPFSPNPYRRGWHGISGNVNLKKIGRKNEI